MKGLGTLIITLFLFCIRIGTTCGNFPNIRKYPNRSSSSLVQGEKVKDLKAEDTFSVGYAKYAFAGLFGGGYPPIGFNFGYGGHGHHGHGYGGYFSPYSFGYGNPYAGIGLSGGGFPGHHGHFGGGYPHFGFHGGFNF